LGPEKGSGKVVLFSCRFIKKVFCFEPVFMKTGSKQKTQAKQNKRTLLAGAFNKD
jgi:hypothetical protein